MERGSDCNDIDDDDDNCCDENNTDDYEFVQDEEIFFGNDTGYDQIIASKKLLLKKRIS